MPPVDDAPPHSAGSPTRQNHRPIEQLPTSLFPYPSKTLDLFRAPAPRQVMSATRKRILVTGGARRVGRRFAEHLSAAGHAVVIHANSNAAEADTLCNQLRRTNPDVWTISADLSDHTAACALIDQASQLAGGPLSGLVNSASVFDYDTPEAMKIDVFDLAMKVNLRAPALLSERFAAQADPARDNCIINLLDQKLWNMNPDFFSYTLSKAALEAANTMLALALAPRVRVVGVAPGLTLTSHMLSDEKFAELHRQSPLGRSSTPQDVAATVAFALDNRSITGTTLLVDGGQHLMRFERDFSLM